MKKTLLFFILALALSACKDDVLNTGASVLPAEDEIVVCVDTFSIKSSLLQADSIYSSPDSMLLGECDSKFGTIHGDILTQLACPEGYEYEEGAEVDSVCIFLVYTTWYGDGHSPMSVQAYELDKNTFYYSNRYFSNIDINEYWSGEDSTYILEHDKIVVAAAPTDSAGKGQYFVRLKTNNDFAKRFFEKQDFSSQDAYSETFKGLYISSDFGSATMLHITDISLGVYYHFTYSRAGVDTLVNNEKWFYSNSEVRRVNRISYSNSTIEKLKKDQDSVNYIVSPAHLYTCLNIPMKEMAESILNKDEMLNKRPYVNMARLRIEVLNKYTGQTSQKTSDDWAQPAAFMLLVKQDAAERFFIKRELPSDSCAIVSALSSGTDSIGNTIYYYSYDLNTLLTQQLRAEEKTETLTMYLMPVSVETSAGSSSGTSTITAVHPLQTVSATTIRSAQNKDNPMRLEVVCSGF